MPKSSREPSPINPFVERYELLGREFADNLGRTDNPDVAKSMHAHFEQDLRDWFYDRVWPYFSTISLDEWSQEESEDVDAKCVNV